MEEQWINDLRKKMASHQTPVPPGLWEGIESALPQLQKPSVPLRRKIMLWTSGISAVAAVLVLVFFLTDRANPVSVRSAEPLATNRTALLEAPSSASKALAWNATTRPATRATSALSLRHSDAASPRTSSAAVVEQGHSSEVAPVETDLGPSPELPPKKTTKSALRENAANFRRTVAPRSQTALLADAVPPHTPSWTLNVYTANLPHTSHHTSGYGEFVAGTALPQDFSQSAQPPVKDLIYSNLGKEIQTKKKHKLPVQFGFSACYQLNPRFSLESGITYTYLSSELTSGTDAHHFVTRQHLQYLGLPLMVNFQIWENKRWNFYLSGGGMLEKCIHGKSDTDFVINHEWVSSEKKNVMEKPLQCSLLATLGAQYNFSSRFSLYAEPGLGYYFDNGSPVETIYKDQPLNFNFRLGFRVRFNP